MRCNKVEDIVKSNDHNYNYTFNLCFQPVRKYSKLMAKYAVLDSKLFELIMAFKSLTIL